MKRQYTMSYEFGTVEYIFTDEQMRQLIAQFKRHIELETGKTDAAIGTHTESVDDAHDDMGHSGYKK